MSTEKVIIYTDGACFPNPGNGGWSAIIVRQGAETEFLSGSSKRVTNNQMEIQGAIEGLKRTKEGESVLIVSDSQYLIRGVTQWVANWIAHNWTHKVSRRFVPCKNIPHWKALLALTSKRAVEWEWVRGHSGDEMNELADRMAFEATGVTPKTMPWWAKKKKHSPEDSLKRTAATG